MQRDLSERAYGAWALFCALGYLALQVAYLKHLPLVNDEFDGAYDVYRLRSEIPYVDFSPYKTVVGYYLQLPGLIVASDVWSGIFTVKYGLAVTNTGLTVLAAWLARRLFSRLALALALPCWLLMSNWLERSSDLRVDALTAWPALFSLLALLLGRPVLAGLLGALTFLISQKGIYFIAASAAALLVPLALAQHEHRRKALRDATRFGIACAVPIAAYFAVFSLLASAATTTRVMFRSHDAIAFTEIYPNIRKFWRLSLLQNPGLYALCGLGVIALGTQLTRDLRRSQLFLYAVALGALLIWHKQPWPYFFVFVGPTAFLLCASAFEIIGRATTGRALTALRWTVLAAALAFALVMPALRAPIILRESQAYQRHMIELASALTRGGERYLAAMDLLYDRTQTPTALRRLSIGTRRALDKAPREKIDEIMRELQETPPKVLVRNERFNGMPPRVRRWLQDNYAPFWGNLELYAPRLTRKPALSLLFAGRYRVTLEGKDKAQSIILDGTSLRHGETMELAAGEHVLEASARGRLHWQPPDSIRATLDNRFKKPGELIGNAYNR